MTLSIDCSFCCRWNRPEDRYDSKTGVLSEHTADQSIQIAFFDGQALLRPCFSNRRWMELSFDEDEGGPQVHGRKRLSKEDAGSLSRTNLGRQYRTCKAV